MNSKVLRVHFLFFLLCIVFGHPTSDETFAERTVVEDSRVVKEEVVKTEVNLKEERIETSLEGGSWKPTVKCGEIVPEEGEPGEDNHAACEAHCIILTEEYKHGKCLKGICHCEQVRRNVETNRNDKTHHRKESNGHPTVKCEHIHPEEEEAAPNNHKACRAHCRSLGSEFQLGQCREGICHCRRETSKVSTTTESAVREKMACKHGDHAKCKSHCRSMNPEDEGKCVSGRCHCGKIEQIEIKIDSDYN